MRVIQYRPSRRGVSTRKKWKKPALWTGASLLTLLVLANGIMWLTYRGRVLPNVSVGAIPAGNIAYADLSDRISVDELLSDTIALEKDSQKKELNPQELGITVDWSATEERLKSQRTWLPLLQLVRHKTVSLELTVDEATFETVQANLAADFTKQPQPERIVFSGSDFEIAPPETGYKLDEANFQQELIATLERGQSTLQVPTETLEPDRTTGGLDADLQALRKKLSTSVKFSVNGNTVEPQAANKGAWFAASGRTMTLSPENTKAYVRTLDASASNLTNAADAVQYALEKNVATTFVLGTSKTPVKYTYCAAGKGVDQSHMYGFFIKTAAVLGDPRGWSAGDKVVFERVETGCDFSLWLSAPSQMTSFGGVCDDYYSCRSGRNVIINFDRWQGATPPWNAAGGNLEDYRVMVTNHEVGHWLGFGHRNCTGPGQPAPVMQQQSIDLQGCSFNPWPTQAELSSLKQARGIAMLPAREDYVAAGATNSCCACGRCAS